MEPIDFNVEPLPKKNRTGGVAFDEDRVNMTLAAGETGSPETSTNGGVVVPTPRPKRRTRFQRVLATKGVLAVPLMGTVDTNTVDPVSRVGNNPDRLGVAVGMCESNRKTGPQDRFFDLA